MIATAEHINMDPAANSHHRDNGTRSTSLFQSIQFASRYTSTLEGSEKSTDSGSCDSGDMEQVVHSNTNIHFL